MAVLFTTTLLLMSFSLKLCIVNVHMYNEVLSVVHIPCVIMYLTAINCSRIKREDATSSECTLHYVWSCSLLYAVPPYCGEASFHYCEPRRSHP